MGKEMWIPMKDGHEVFLCNWIEEFKPPRAILQLAHGMAEHSARYQEFAMELAALGIGVYANDHRGHGRTGEKSGTMGHLNNENGFERVVADLKEINEFIHLNHPDIPVFLMGHSMGSFFVRRFIQKYPAAVKGVILSGTGGDPGFSGRVAKTVVASQLKIKGTQTPSPLLNQLFFGDFNKSVKSPETKFDWLTRDRDEVQKYIDDPFCGFIPTVGFFADLLEGLNTIHQDNEIAKIEKDLPFYFISGDQDPVGKKTKAVSRIINQYKKHGVKRIEYKFYKDGRHEMLNEINRQEVVNDIVNWLQKQLLY